MAPASKLVLSAPERRYLLWRGGKTIEEIAAMEKVAVQTVDRSIAMVQGHRASLNTNEMHMSEIDVVNFTPELQKAALAAALTATVKVEENGKIVDVPDHEIRLKAVNAITNKVEALTPKAKGGIFIGVNSSQPGGAASDKEPHPTSRGRRFEDMVRDINEQRLLPGGSEPRAEGNILEGDCEPALTP